MQSLVATPLAYTGASGTRYTFAANAIGYVRREDVTILVDSQKFQVIE